MATTERHRRIYYEARGFVVVGDRIRCEQCQACSINGVPCHEQGCPNVVPVCRECGGLDPERTCCTENEEGL